MSKKSVVSNIKLNSFNDLFGDDATKEGIVEVPLQKLYAFENHPFKVTENDEMAKLVESVKENGVLSPILVRERKKSGYEIISGHRRARAAALAKLSSVPAIVKELSDDEATVLMVDANIQREEILPSEKAKAYKMKYDAMKNQGLPGNSLHQIGEESGENYKAIQRYIWIARLNDDLLEMVDIKKLGLLQSVSVSFLSKEEQEMLYPLLKVMNHKLSTKQAEHIKGLSLQKELTERTLTDYLSTSKETLSERKVTLKQKKLDEYFPENYSGEEIESILYELLDDWKKRNIS